MIEYYEQLSEEEQDDIKHVIQTLYRQTFLLERKFEKRTGRMVPVREYRVCSRAQGISGEHILQLPESHCRKICIWA